VQELPALSTHFLLDMATKFKSDLRKLELSPTINPLMEPQQVTTKRRYVRSGRSDELMSTSTGEISAVSTIHMVEERDDAEFVKVFAAGVAASYDLSRTAQRVFQVVLDQYQRTPMSRGFADYVNLLWFDDGLEGRDVGMSEYTFKRGLRELLDKRFIAAKDGVSFWTNPALFFKGDRVMFIKEYRRRRTTQAQELEAAGQQRLDV
jgi:Firmicute plasmid replication protein (RepL)